MINISVSGPQNITQRSADRLAYEQHKLLSTEQTHAGVLYETVFPCTDMAKSLVSIPGADPKNLGGLNGVKSGAEPLVSD